VDSGCWFKGEWKTPHGTPAQSPSAGNLPATSSSRTCKIVAFRPLILCRHHSFIGSFPSNPDSAPNPRLGWTWALVSLDSWERTQASSCLSIPGACRWPCVLLPFSTKRLKMMGNPPPPFDSLLSLLANPFLNVNIL
jgi:hypothetical protein